MAVVLNHAMNGHSATSVDPDYVVFPAAQEISISGPDDTITPVDDSGVYVPLATASNQALQDSRLVAAQGHLSTLETRITKVDTDSVIIASGNISASQSGTWTVQPGNTANTTAWKVDGSEVTQPVSGSVTTLPIRSTLTDRSGTAGSTSSTLMSANSNRNYLFIQNVSGADIWINFTLAAAAASPSVRLSAGDIYEMNSGFISTEAINVIRTGILDLNYVAKEG